jgi:hypothetical protein
MQQTEGDEELREALASERRVTRRDWQIPAPKRRELLNLLDLVERELLGA